MKRQGISAWLRKSDAQSAFQRTKGYCERIICVYGENCECGWWHDLEHADGLLFTEGARIVEIDLDNLSICVGEAVEQGFRPVIFIDGMLNWAPAMTALGKHQAFGNVYALGRDDLQMSDLLHYPSEEIQSVVHDGGQIVVPNIDYGMALDSYFNTNLKDFDITEFNAKDPLAPTLKLVCRINPFRYLDVKLYCKNGIARLSQKYLVVDESEESDESCNLPLRFNEWLLDFAKSNPFSTEDISEEHAAFMKAFTEMFELPQAFQGWEPNTDPPWKILLQRLHQMSLGLMNHLNAAQQELISIVDKNVLAQALDEFGATLSGVKPVLSPVRSRLHDGPSDTRMSKDNPAFIILSTTSENESGSTVFDVTWLFKDKPVAKPEVIFDESFEPVPSSPISYEWSEDLMSLSLFGIEIKDMGIGWVWLAEENVLKISLINQEHSTDHS